MNEIEKMYKNAGIKKINIHQSEIDNGDPRFTGISHSDSYIKYPPFTAEKQIKLLEFNYKYSRVPDIGYIIELKKYDCPHYKEYGAFDTFQEVLCADINYHWKYFTEEEKEQIREILR